MNNRPNDPACKWLAALVGVFAVLCSAAHAQSFPDYPLQTGAGDVAPNILFILDDSGSMAWRYMYNTDISRMQGGGIDSSGSGDNVRNDNSYTTTSDVLNAIYDQNYVTNTLYYNPQNNYQGWVQDNGTRMTAGTTWPTAYSSSNGTSGSATLSDSPQIFYVPKNGVTTNAALANPTNYWRYLITADDVVRSEWGSVTSSTGTPTGFPASISGARQSWQYYTITIPAGTTRLVISTSGGSGDADLYVRQGSRPTSGTNDCQSLNSNNNETCTINSPTIGAIYHVGVYAYSAFSGATITATLTRSNSCGPSSGSNGWINCTSATPTGRTVDAERNNFTTWYSYHRTRLKLAKAGASEAFGQLVDNVRVGYRSLHQNGSNNYDIPVGVDAANNLDGVFKSTARTTWFTRLFAATASNGTPLHSALDSAGQYFSGNQISRSSPDPYGPAVAGTQLACRQNFAILTTDGYWNTRSVDPGNQDGSDGSSIIDHSVPTNDPTRDVVRYRANQASFPPATNGNPFRDSNSLTGTNRNDTLADVAMRYWKNDLRPNLDNVVPTSSSNPAFWQHMVTFGISIGLKGTVDQTSVASVLRDGRPRINGAAVDWPNPMNSENATRIDDLLHAAVNGRGEFIAATNATAFRDALTSVLGQIQARLASGSNVATNSTSFQSDTRLYQATYRSKVWSGDLVARDVTRVGGISNSEAWRVSERIEATYADSNAANDYHNRTVLTWDGTRGVSFPTAAQTTALQRTSTAVGQPPVVTGAANASYIKGNRALELSNNGALRNRSNLLGDIVNSSPVYVRESESIFVGANDGMLHGINALTGDVRFSYVPAGLDFTRLGLLSDPAYEHAFFVDGAVAVSGSTVDATNKYLIGSLGRGGKGVFSLNVTTPASPSVTFDNTAATDADMGFVIGVPLIVKGNNGGKLAIVSNGIDSTRGSATLYVYNVETGAQLAKLTAGTASGNGLSSPRAADLDGNGTVDYVYAGDLRGNIWKFDLTSASPGSWHVALNGQPLFVATDANGNRQPITGGVAIAREPTTGETWVSFGTGRLVQVSDPNSLTVQSLYGIVDRDTPIARSDLTARRIAAVSADGSQRAFQRYEALPETSSGWVVNLGTPLAGERVISGARINERAVFISSIIPTPGSGCEDNGAGYLNILDVFAGTSAKVSGGGDGSFFDLNNNGSGSDETLVGSDGQTYYIGSIDLGVGMPTESGQIENMVLVCGTGGVCEEENLAAQEGGAGQPRRVSWRELINNN